MDVAGEGRDAVAMAAVDSLCYHYGIFSSWRMVPDAAAFSAALATAWLL